MSRLLRFAHATGAMKGKSESCKSPSQSDDGADFNGADLASTRLIEPIGLDAAKNFDKAQNIERLLRQ
jgi:hypothetical protein